MPNSNPHSHNHGEQKSGYTVHVEISGLLVAQLKYDMLNANGSCMGFVVTTDDAEDATATATAVVVTAYTPFTRAAFDAAGVFFPDAVATIPDILGIYSYRKSTTIVDAAISLREDALIDSLLTLPRFNLPASATSTSTPLLFLFTSTHDGPVMDFDFAAYTPRHSNATNTLPYTLVPIRISNLIESTQSSHSVFISSLPLTGAAGALLAPVVAGLDPLAHVGTYENVLGESVRALAAALEDLVKSEADVVELRKRALEKRKRKEVAVEASISTVDENKIDGGFRSFF